MKSLSIAKLNAGSVVWIAVIAIAAGTGLLSYRDSCAASGPGADDKSGIDERASLNNGSSSSPSRVERTKA